MSITKEIKYPEKLTNLQTSAKWVDLKEKLKKIKGSMKVRKERK